MKRNKLEYFKKLLLKEKERIEKGLRTATEDLKDNAGRSGGDQIDEAVALSQVAMSLRMKERDNGLLTKVNFALTRINDATFGECNDCGEDIGEKRLKIRPVTVMCVVCKERQEKLESTFA